MYRLLLSAELRRRWRGWVSVAVLVAVAGAFVLAVAAGARRTASAYTRFRAATRSPDLFFSLPANADPALVDRLRAVPGIGAVVGFTYLPVVPDRPGVVPFQNAGAFGPFGPEFGDVVYRYLVLEGRRPDPRRADEVTVNRELAELTRLHVGQRIRLKSAGDVVHDEATVVGIHRGEFDVGVSATSPSMLVTAAFMQRHREVFRKAFGDDLRPAYLVRLDAHDAATKARITGAVDRLFGVQLGTPPTNPIENGIRVQAIALTLLAVIAGLAAAVAIAQASSRLVVAGADERAIWRGLGLRRAQRAGAAAMPALATGAVAAAAAVIGAAFASSVFPRGLAGLVEPDPGRRVDVPVLVLGAFVLIGLTALGAAIAAWRDEARRGAETTPEARLLGRLAWSAPAMVGVRATVGGLTASARAQARAAVAAGLAAVLGVTAVVVFAASQRHLFRTPVVHGWTFDLTLRPPPERIAALREQATKSGGVTGLAQAGFDHLQIGDQHPEVMVFEPLRGDAHPALVAGRAPRTAGDIALSAAIARHVHARIGQRVTVRGPAGDVRMNVVGRASYPAIGPDGDFDNEVSMTPAAAARLGLDGSSVMLLVRLADGGAGKAADAALVRAAGDDTEIVRPFLPPQLTNLRRAGDAPAVLGGFLVFLGALALVHALLVAIRAGRRDIAVLRALGFVRRQVRAVLAWQASGCVVASLLVGIPLGIVAGRLSWGLVAGRLGVLPRPVLEAQVFALVTVIAIALANLVGLFASTRALRLRPSEVLRSE